MLPLLFTPTATLPASDRSDVRNSPSRDEEIIDTILNQCKDDKPKRDALKNFQTVSQNVASFIERESEIFCTFSLSGCNFDNQVLYPIYTPTLVTALQCNNSGNCIACSVMSDALNVVRKLSKRHLNRNSPSTSIFAMLVRTASLIYPHGLITSL